MAIDFSTEHLADRDQIPFWVDVASKAFYAHDFATSAETFDGRLSSGTIEGVMLTHCDCGPCEVSRTGRDMRRDDVDNYILSIRFDGCSALTQDDRTVKLKPGSVVWHTTSKPIRLDFPEQTSSLHISVGRQLMRSRIGNIDAMQLLDSSAPATGLAVDFIRSLAGRIGSMDAALHPRLADHVLDLIAMALASDGRKAELSAPRELALRRLKAEIEKRLADPNLKPANAAALAGMSVRYANMLLAEEGLSLERYIVQRRLERCRQALADPLQARRMIGDIAFAWGFSDHSHFTRRFRAAFGMTPAEYRAQHTLAKVRV